MTFYSFSYTLLGASGCGKSTLLGCIVGLRELSSGEILVFGHEPGTKESGVPGRRVGYVPQDYALYQDLSIKESLQYFGTLYSMTKEEIESQSVYLGRILDLPPPNRKISTMR